MVIKNRKREWEKRFSERELVRKREQPKDGERELKGKSTVLIVK